MTIKQIIAHLKKFRSISPLIETCSEQAHLEHGIARALTELWRVEGIHPARIAALALEDENCHRAAAVCFNIADGKPINPTEINQIQDHIVCG